MVWQYRSFWRHKYKLPTPKRVGSLYLCFILFNFLITNFMSKEFFRSLAIYWWAVVIFVVAMFVYTYHLSNTDIYGLDEAFYIESPREMISMESYFVPYFKQKVRIRKPILFYWFVIGSYNVFGESVASARLPSIFFAFLGAFVLFRFYKMFFDDVKGGCYSLIVLLSSFHYMYHAKMATLDMTLTTFILMSMYYASRGIFYGDTRKNFFLSSIFTGLAVATKGPIGLLIPCLGIICFTVLSKKDGKLYILKSFFCPRNISVVFLLGAGWYVLLLFKLGWKVFYHVLVIELFSRVIGHDLTITKNLMLHIMNFFRTMFPWSLLFIPVVLHRKKLLAVISEEDEEKVLFLFSWVLAVFVILLFIFPYYARYLLPMVPPAAMLLGYFMVKLECVLGCKWLRRLHTVSSSVLCVMAAALFILWVCSVAFFRPLSIYFWLLTLLAAFGAAVLYRRRSVKDFKVFALVVSVLLLVNYAVLLGDVAVFFKHDPFKVMVKYNSEGLRKADVFVTLGPDKKAQNWIPFLGKRFIDKCFDVRKKSEWLKLKAFLENPDLYSSGTVNAILPTRLFESLGKRWQDEFIVMGSGKKFEGRIKLGTFYNRFLKLGISKGIESFRTEYIFIKHETEII